MTTTDIRELSTDETSAVSGGNPILAGIALGQLSILAGVAIGHAIANSKYPAVAGAAKTVQETVRPK